MVLLHTSQGEMGEAGAEGTEGDKGEIGLKGTEGPPGPAGLVGVKVSVPAVRSKCSTLPEKKRLFTVCPLTSLSTSSHRARRGNLD